MMFTETPRDFSISVISQDPVRQKSSLSYHHHIQPEICFDNYRLFSTLRIIDRELVTSAKKFANFNEFSEIKKIRKNWYKNSLNARVGVAR